MDGLYASTAAYVDPFVQNRLKPERKTDGQYARSVDNVELTHLHRTWMVCILLTRFSISIFYCRNCSNALILCAVVTAVVMFLDSIRVALNDCQILSLSSHRTMTRNTTIS